MPEIAVPDETSPNGGGPGAKDSNRATKWLGDNAKRILKALEWIGEPVGLALAAVIAPVPWLLRRVATTFPPFSRSETPLIEAMDPRGSEGTEGASAGGDPRSTARAAGGVLVKLGSSRLGHPTSQLSFPKAAALFVVFTLTWAFAVAMQRIDQAVQQMGTAGGSGLGFPWVVGNFATPDRTAPAIQVRVEKIRSGWELFATSSRPQGATEGAGPFRQPQEIVGNLVGLDLAFIALYATLFAVAIVWMKGVSDHEADADEPNGGQRRRRALLTALGALVLLIPVDLVEDFEIWRVLVHGGNPVVLPGGIGLGSLMSGLKMVLGVVVIGTLLVIGAVLALRWRGLRRAIVATRGVYYVVALLFVLLMMGIGAHQIDDVVRGWTLTQMVLAVLSMTILAGASRGVVRRLSSVAMDSPQPATGKPSQNLLAGAGITLIVGGALMGEFGWGWGLVAPGVLLLAIWLLGVTFEAAPRWPAADGHAARDQGGRRGAQARPGAGRRVAMRVVFAVCGAAVGVLVGLLVDLPVVGCALGGLFLALVVVARLELSRGHVESGDGGQEPTAKLRDELAIDTLQATADDEITPAVNDFGERLGRVTGAVIVAMVVVVITRAVALAFSIDAEGERPIIPVAGAVIALAIGAAVFGCKPSALLRTFGTNWFMATVASGLIVLLLAQDGLSVGLASWLGTMTIVFVGLTLILGLMSIAASAARQGPIRTYRLPAGLRSVGFHRFPTVLFLVAWLLVVSSLDSGGFHDVRTTTTHTEHAVPSIGSSLKDYLAANVPAPGKDAQPVVLVGASGGGIRAAVWTSLVMECLFGPGPVTDSSKVCAVPGSALPKSTLAKNAKQPLPVFLASGASGGSVGLATWTARRADLVQDGDSAQIPERIEDMLSGDLVAPLMGRFLTGDLPMAFLAGNSLDRAAMLEQGWEAAYRRTGDQDGRGLQRGMLETWAQTHSNHAWLSPVLAMNGTSMGDGCRFVTSPVDFTLPNQTRLADIDDEVATKRPSLHDKPDDAACRGTNNENVQGVSRDILPSTNELIDYLCPTQDVPMSTAAHLSARFPYVSPTGRIYTPGCGTGTVPGPAVSYIADGGIFDNAGSGTAVDAWRALAPLAAEKEREAKACIVPLFVQIDNSPPTDIVADVTSLDGRPMELIAPITATAGQLASREEYARATAASAFSAPRSVGGRVVEGTDTLFFRITLRGQPGPEPPLGWTLAPDTVKDMRRQLASESNVDAIHEIRRLITGGLRCGT